MIFWAEHKLIVLYFKQDAEQGAKLITNVHNQKFQTFKGILNK
jgi:hypothetical protein